MKGQTGWFDSNVPATLLFGDFTSNWRSLLWGSNVGGFGNVVASFANLIAYRLYISQSDVTVPEARRFTVQFVSGGYVLFFLGILLYAWLEASL